MIQEIAKRVKKPTPKFFKVVRNIGLALASISGVILAAPVALPVGLITAAGYIAVTGGVMGAISQMTVEGGE
ncbi:hypothetical protein [Emticicia sp. SJ17W-69]|uniref:hypothetical protein n=1 Tax=Emticicia sp. SJ17W-69 TaxID=3421657 RepID=UPI003EBD456D